MGISFLLTLMIGLFLLSVSQSILRVVMTSQITKNSNNQNQGMILGILSSVMSLSMIIGPILAGALFSIKINFPFWASACFGILAFIILFFENNKNKLLKNKIDNEDLEIAEQKIEFVS